MAKTVFERVIAGEFEGSFVYRDDRCAAFMDISPLNAGHVLVVPLEPIEKLTSLAPKLAAHLFEVAQKILRAIEKSGLKIEGANLFMSDGKVAGQEVPHIHLHIVPRFTGDGLGLSFGKALVPVQREELNRIAAQIARAL